MQESIPSLFHTLDAQRLQFPDDSYWSSAFLLEDC